MAVEPSARLAGRRAIVTGASSGIGAAIAVAFARAGALVSAVGRDAKRTEETVEAITRGGGTAVALVADLEDRQAIAAVCARTASELGGLDTVVNCAGVSELGGLVPVHEQAVDAWDRTIATNVTAPFLVARACLPHLLEAGGGSMVHISSIAAVVVISGSSPYGASKAALNQLSGHIAVEYASQNIRSNVIMPGEIDTPASSRAFVIAAESGLYTREDLLAKYPGRRFGTPEEVAAMAVFLCSDEAAFLSGAAIPVDGAFTKAGY
jgi:NAD(P)-dependent dehydrogenase (short-subunit alcohol dehydrogenase family)